MICMGGLIITMVSWMILRFIQHFFYTRILIRLTFRILACALCPVFWIYRSDKLRAVLKKWTGIWIKFKWRKYNPNVTNVNTLRILMKIIFSCERSSSRSYFRISRLEEIDNNVLLVSVRVITFCHSVSTLVAKVTPCPFPFVPSVWFSVGNHTDWTLH